MTNRRRRRSSHSKQSQSQPKGSYPLPDGTYVTESIGPPDRRGRRLRIRAVHHAEPDADKVARALIAWVIERAQDRADH